MWRTHTTNRRKGTNFRALTLLPFGVRETIRKHNGKHNVVIIILSPFIWYNEVGTCYYPYIKDCLLPILRSLCSPTSLSPLLSRETLRLPHPQPKHPVTPIAKCIPQYLLPCGPYPANHHSRLHPQPHQQDTFPSRHPQLLLPSVLVPQAPPPALIPHGLNVPRSLPPHLLHPTSAILTSAPTRAFRMMIWRISRDGDCMKSKHEEVGV